MNRRRGDERGATLVLVLILVTVLASALSATMSLIDTSQRTTVAMDDQASATYAADGAAQTSVQQLQSDTFNGGPGGCNSVTTAVMPNFYPAVGGSQGASAAVRCTPDPGNSTGTGGANSSPGSALLSLGTASGEDGIWDGSVNNQTIKVSGGIFSNSTINLGGFYGGRSIGSPGNSKSVIANVADNSYVRSLGACSGPGNITVTGATTKICDYSSDPMSASDRRGLDPQLVPGHGESFDPPPAPDTLRTAPACAGRQVYELQPGLYQDAAALNALTAGSSCAKSVVHLKPGRYYFDFNNPGAHKWSINSAWVVGGTPTSPLSTASPPAMTAANPSCVAPGTAGASTTSGVMLVFGGDSRMDWSKSGTDNGMTELCASNAASGPPVAIYGLKSSIGSGAMQVSAQAGCITAVPYVTGGDATHCALLQSYQDPSPVFTVRGTVYAPHSPIDLVFNNSSAQYFRWGLVARTILINSMGSASALSGAVISVPDDAPAPFPNPSLFFLEVFVCPGASTCDASGSVRLRAKVQLSETPPTTAKVLSWSTSG